MEMNGAEFVRTGLRTTTSTDELESSMDVYEHMANRKTSAGSICMKGICHRARANSQLAPQTAKKKRSSACAMHTVIEILKDRTPDHIGARALHRALKTAPTSTARRKMADRLAMLTEKEGITRERKLFSEIRQLKTFRVQHRPGW